jgi:hypothetical protein
MDLSVIDNFQKQFISVMNRYSYIGDTMSVSPHFDNLIDTNVRYFNSNVLYLPILRYYTLKKQTSINIAFLCDGNLNKISFADDTVFHITINGKYIDSFSKEVTHDELIKNTTYNSMSDDGKMNLNRINTFDIIPSYVAVKLGVECENNTYDYDINLNNIAVLPFNYPVLNLFLAQLDEEEECYLILDCATKNKVSPTVIPINNKNYFYFDFKRSDSANRVGDHDKYLFDCDRDGSVNTSEIDGITLFSNRALEGRRVHYHNFVHFDSNDGKFTIKFYN